MKTQKVSFLHSITMKVTMTLIVFLVVVIALVVYVVKKDGHTQIKKVSSDLVIKTGQVTATHISANLEIIEQKANRIRDNGQTLPLDESIFRQILHDRFNKESAEVLSTSILPNTQAKKTFKPIIELKTDAINNLTENLDYTKTDWYQLVQNTVTQGCFWSHLEYNYIAKKRYFNCSQTINRDGSFWGINNLTISADVFNDILAKIGDETDGGYALLLDNNNQIISSSNPEKIPVINKKTNEPHNLADYVKENSAWQTVANSIYEYQKERIYLYRPSLDKSTLEQVRNIADPKQQNKDSMILNHRASQTVTNSNNVLYLDNLALDKDSYYHNNSQAYIFLIPETNWNLVVVQSDKKLSSVADNLSNNLIKYIIFALLFMMVVMFFMLHYFAFSPLEETVSRIMQAVNLINVNKYHKLQEVDFKKVRKDEIGVVNQSLQKLLLHIEANEGQLATINQVLESKVKARTTELVKAIDNLKHSQVKLIRSEKMATLGQMVAGVAHEVNTPLTYVQNNVEIIGQLTEPFEELLSVIKQLKDRMMDETISENEVEKLMDNMITLADELEEDEIIGEIKNLIKDTLFGVEQISDMVLNLRNFARIDESQVKKIDLRDCVTTSLKIAHTSIKYLTVNKDLQDIPEISCSPSQVNQVIINLLNNAAQAIGKKADGVIDIRVHANDKNVMVTVKDNGSGMSYAVQDKIFEPFFTTKPAGEGTGLGMAISQQIMEQHNGTIQVLSKEDVGTTFCLVFPIANTTESKESI